MHIPLENLCYELYQRGPIMLKSCAYSLFSRVVKTQIPQPLETSAEAVIQGVMGYLQICLLNFVQNLKIQLLKHSTFEYLTLLVLWDQQIGILLENSTSSFLNRPPRVAATQCCHLRSNDEQQARLSRIARAYFLDRLGKD